MDLMRCVNAVMAQPTLVFMGLFHDLQLASCLGVIKHGLLENEPFISDVPNKTSIQFGDFITP